MSSLEKIVNEGGFAGFEWSQEDHNTFLCGYGSCMKQYKVFFQTQVEWKKRMAKPKCQKFRRALFKEFIVDMTLPIPPVKTHSPLCLIAQRLQRGETLIQRTVTVEKDTPSMGGMQTGTAGQIGL
jgi:hypothetical protein